MVNNDYYLNFIIVFVLLQEKEGIFLFLTGLV